MTDGVLSLTKHYVFDRLISEIASITAGLTPNEVRSRLKSPHIELFDDLFRYDRFGVVDSILMEVCRSGSPGATRIVWVALVGADHRLQRVIAEVLSGPSGKLVPEAFSTEFLEGALAKILGSPSRKAASNILHYYEQARIVVPEKRGNTIVGIEAELDTRSAVPLAVAYFAERHEGQDPLQLALESHVNAWLNLTPEDFTKAFLEPGEVALTPTGAGSTAHRKTAPAGIPSSTAPRLDYPYREEDEAVGIRLSGTREFDPDVMERASQAHRKLQNHLARWLRHHGLTPVSPAASPRFDVGWWADNVFWVAEVKSFGVENEAHQIRLGLGQVLDYVHQLAGFGLAIRAALVVEEEPAGGRWADLCASHGVVLTWPPFRALQSALGITR